MSTLTYQFHCSHLAHFSHDYVEVTYDALLSPGKRLMSGTHRVDLHGTRPTEIELRPQYLYGGDSEGLARSLVAAMRADREFIPALLRAKQAEIEKELATSQRRVEKLLTARDKLRALTAE